MQFRSLPGITPYAKAHALQLELVEARVKGEIEDTILLVEHEPVVTRGRGLQWTGDSSKPRSMPLPAPLPAGVESHDIERGGDWTYHGPGQLVVYPIVKLDGSGFGPARDVTAYLRRLESVLSQVLKTYGLETVARENATGVWVKTPSEARPQTVVLKKIASIGIAVRKWVTYHGIGLNVTNPLEPFHWISPCGFSSEVMTRLIDLAPVEAEWRAQIESRLKTAFLKAAFNDSLSSKSDLRTV